MTKIENALNWMGDQLLELRDSVELSVGTRELIDGMNVEKNYNVIYEKINKENPELDQWQVKLISGTGSIIQAYTGPLLKHAVGKLAGYNVFTKKTEMIISEVGDLNGGYAYVAEKTGTGVANVMAKGLSWLKERGNLNNNIDNNIYVTDSDTSSHEISLNSNGQTLIANSDSINNKDMMAGLEAIYGNYDKVSINNSSYTIQKGDTISALAQRWGLSVNEVIEQNPWLADRTSADGNYILIRSGEKIDTFYTRSGNRTYFNTTKMGNGITPVIDGNSSKEIYINGRRLSGVMQPVINKKDGLPEKGQWEISGANVRMTFTGEQKEGAVGDLWLYPANCGNKRIRVKDFRMSEQENFMGLRSALGKIENVRNADFSRLYVGAVGCLQSMKDCIRIRA